MTEDQQPALPITALILRRSKELGLTRTEIVRRCGYSNIAKGLRRLEELCVGEFHSTRGLLQSLPAALEISPNLVAKAVEDTKRYFHETEEAAWRAAFVPHAIIVTERRIPQPIFIAAIIGVDRLLRVDFDLTRKPVSFADQGLQGIQEKLAKWKSKSLPAFGCPIGVIVNYRPDHAVEFDLQGKPIMAYDHAHRPGKATFSISGRPLTEGEIAKLFGMTDA